MRRFLLENEKGQQFRMDKIKEGCLLVSPSNLGYSYITDFSQIGNYFIENNRKLDQKNPSGIAYFRSYDRVKEFIDFIEGSELLKWVYIVPYESGEKTYYKDVEIQSLDKTEKVGRWLACPLVFNGMSLWYEKNTIIYTIEPSTNEIRWDFEWDSKFSDYNSRSMEYINQGHTEAPVLVEINGHVSNPSIQLYVEGQLYQTVSFNIEIDEYEKLLYGTQENNFYIKKQNTDGTLEDIYDLDVIDFNNDNCIRIPKNRSCEIRLVADTEILNAQVTILAYYKAV